jgi:hypothetical protein
MPWEIDEVRPMPAKSVLLWDVSRSELGGICNDLNSQSASPAGECGIVNSLISDHITGHLKWGSWFRSWDMRDADLDLDLRSDPLVGVQQLG